MLNRNNSAFPKRGGARGEPKRWYLKQMYTSESPPPCQRAGMPPAAWGWVPVWLAAMSRRRTTSGSQVTASPSRTWGGPGPLPRGGTKRLLCNVYWVKKMHGKNEVGWVRNGPKKTLRAFSNMGKRALKKNNASGGNWGNLPRTCKIRGT